MGNLSQFGSNLAAQNANGSSSPGDGGHDHAADGYASEDFVPGSSSSRERKKGTPWTEEEHRMFLLGLQKLGKGDWRGISRNYVVSRTPTQVASHAQKYFIRQSNVSRRKRRSSLFDIVADDASDLHQDIFSTNHTQAETQSNNDQLSIPPALDEEDESMESSNSNDGEPAPPKPESPQSFLPVMYPTYFSPFFPFPVPIWPGYRAEPTKTDSHEILKPTAVHSKNPINVDELVGMSKLSLGESIADAAPSSLSLKLLDGSSSRQSAFHAKPAPSSSSSSVIHAV